LWQVLRAAGLEGRAFGSWYEFVRLFQGSKGRFGYDWGKPSEEVPDRLRRVMLHRRREEVLPDLPTKTRRDILVNSLDRATLAACDHVLSLLKERGHNLDEMMDATKAAGVIFEEMSRVRAMLAAAKIPTLIELVEDYEENEEPLVVFSAHTAPIEALGKREGWATITGATSSDERGRVVEKFQSGELRGIAGTLGAMGTGVTLTHAHHVLMVDLAWTPALNSQAEDRCCRIGQDRGVIISRMIVKHPLDERVAQLLTIKQEIIEASVEASSVQADYVGSSPAEELVRAVEDAEKALVDVQEQKRVADETAVQRRQQELELTKARLGNSHDGRELSINGNRRSAANELEAWAARGLVQVAEFDSDHARERNAVGFNKLDNEFGHSLADQIRDRGVLTDKQWAAAVKLARKYRRQIGAEPMVKN